MRCCRTSWRPLKEGELTDGDGDGDQGRSVGVDRPRRGARSTRCTGTRRPSRRCWCARWARRSSPTTCGPSSDLHRWLTEQGDWVPLGAADEKKAAAEGTVEAFGPLAGQPGRRLVRPAQGLPGPLRHVPPAAAGGAGPGRGHPRGAQQPHARRLIIATRRKSTAPCRRPE